MPKIQTAESVGQQDAAANVRPRRDIEWVTMLLSSLCQQFPIPAQMAELAR
jgi:hypothetical protein